MTKRREAESGRPLNLQHAASGDAASSPPPSGGLPAAAADPRAKPAAWPLHKAGKESRTAPSLQAQARAGAMLRLSRVMRNR